MIFLSRSGIRAFDLLWCARLLESITEEWKHTYHIKGTFKRYEVWKSVEKNQPASNSQ